MNTEAKPWEYRIVNIWHEVIKEYQSGEDALYSIPDEIKSRFEREWELAASGNNTEWMEELVFLQELSKYRQVVYDGVKEINDLERTIERKKTNKIKQEARERQIEERKAYGRKLQRIYWGFFIFICISLIIAYS